MASKRQRPDDGPPIAAGEFVGRHAEVQRINTLLSSSARLLTLVGPGGIGKTRLAAEALRQHHAMQPRPIYWTRLARLAHGADAATITEEIAQSVAEADIPGRSAWAVLLDSLTASDAPVLVLDNCEHVLTGAGALIADLLDTVPRLTILATSREPIGWADEHLLTVPPLPPAQALELFLRRAELTGRSIADDPEQIAVADRICRRVDHNPLFIRLAAARVRHQPPSNVLDELTGDADDKRMNWSHPARVGIDERHRGVRDVIAWSYGLCRNEERRLLDRMSVFAVGYEIDGDEPEMCGAELDAIQAVCADDWLSAADIERILERLVERSLVSVHITGSATLYYLLECVRVFTRDRLLHETKDGAQIAADLAHKHLRYYRDKAVAGQAMWYGPDEHLWLDWAQSAWDNLIIAIETSLADQAEAVVGLEIAYILMSLRTLFVKGANRAITRLTERALTATSSVQPPPTELRIDAMALVGWIALWQGRSAYTAQLLDECAALCLPDPDVCTTWRDTAETDIGLPSMMEFTWGLELMLIHMDPRAITVVNRALHKAAAGGDRDAQESCELLLAFSSAFVGNAQQALDNTEQYLNRAKTLGSPWAIAWAMVARSIALTKHGHASEALAVAQEALVHHLSAGDTWTASWVVGSRAVALVQILADRLANGGDGAESVAMATEIACIVGGFTAQHRSMGIAVDQVPMILAEVQRVVTVAREVLGTDGFAAAASDGTRLRPEFDELQQFVLGTLPADRLTRDPPGTPATPSPWNKLSGAERDIAVLAAAGWSNSAIAARRGSSVRTVDAQLATIRQKLMISSRSEIIGHVPDELDDRVRTESECRPDGAANENAQPQTSGPGNARGR